MTNEWIRHKKIPHFLPLSSKCDLDLRATGLGLTRATLSYDGRHFCKVSLKSNKE